jgi:hypothetical protein
MRKSKGGLRAGKKGACQTGPGADLLAMPAFCLSALSGSLLVCGCGRVRMAWHDAHLSCS